MHSFASGSGKTVAVHALAIAIALAALCGAGQQPISSCGTITGDRWVHVVSRGESWTTIGARVGVDPAVLARRNGFAVGVPLNPGDVLGIDNRHIVPGNAEGDELLINLPQRMLFDYRQGAVRASYPIAVGRPDWPTPVGSFSIVAMESNPTWDVPVSIQEEMRNAGKPVVKTVPPGPDNPLGALDPSEPRVTLRIENAVAYVATLQAPPAAASDEGARLFKTHCATCHGTTARGDGPIAEHLRHAPPDLTTYTDRNGGVFPSDRVARIIDGRDVPSHGDREMPVWGDAFSSSPDGLPPESVKKRIEAFIRYLAGIQRRSA
jgi:mono/diheme cytochrome c family protein